jgi:hypothetical protein
MLLAGVSLEDVSRLLTHESIKTTEKYYARWVKARREQFGTRLLRRCGSRGHGQHIMRFRCINTLYG